MKASEIEKLLATLTDEKKDEFLRSINWEIEIEDTHRAGRFLSVCIEHHQEAKNLIVQNNKTLLLPDRLTLRLIREHLRGVFNGENVADIPNIESGMAARRWFAVCFHPVYDGFGCALRSDLQAFQTRDQPSTFVNRPAPAECEIIRQRNALLGLRRPASLDAEENHLRLQDTSDAYQKQISSYQENTKHGATAKLLAEEFRKSESQMRRHLTDARKAGRISCTDNLSPTDVKNFRGFMAEPGRMRKRKKS